MKPQLRNHSLLKTRDVERKAEEQKLQQDQMQQQQEHQLKLAAVPKPVGKPPSQQLDTGRHQPAAKPPEAKKKDVEKPKRTRTKVKRDAAGLITETETQELEDGTE